MTDVFEEVEESLRQDRATRLWKSYGGYLIGAVVLVIAGVAAWEVYSWQRGQTIETHAAAYATAMRAYEANKLDEAKAGFEPLASGKGGFAVLANHMLAEVDKQLQADDAAVAASLDRAAKLDDGPMGRLALLKLAYLRADTADLAELTTLVQPLVDAGGNESALARELLAAKAFASGDVEKARTEFQTLSLDLEAPQAMKQRVQQMLAGMPARAPAAAATSTPATPAAATTPAATPPAAEPTAPAPAAPQQ